MNITAQRGEGGGMEAGQYTHIYTAGRRFDWSDLSTLPLRLFADREYNFMFFTLVLWDGFLFSSRFIFFFFSLISWDTHWSPVVVVGGGSSCVNIDLCSGG